MLAPPGDGGSRSVRGGLVAGDVTRSDDLKRLVDEAVQAFGAADIVIPNAGIARVVAFEASTAEVAQVVPT